MADPLPATVPPPVPPDASAAWYAPTVRDQYRVDPNLVATVREVGDSFEYDVREPPLAVVTRVAANRVETFLDGARIDRPRTREGTVDRMAAGLSRPYRRVVDRLTETTPDQRRRLDYHLTASIEGLDALTPLALDDRVRVADASDDAVVVHTTDFAPARTQLATDIPYLDRFVSERLSRYTVSVLGAEVPVTVYREHVLGGDVFETKYHVHSQSRLPGDDELVSSVKRRIVEESVDGPVTDRQTYVRDRARQLLTVTRLVGSPRSLLDGVQRRLANALAAVGLRDSPRLDRDPADRVDDLVNAVLRDLVAEDRLTVPIRDPHIERVEANRVGERVKVVPKPGAFENAGRIPTTTTIEDGKRFVTLARRLAAAGGVELGPRTPHASVSYEPTPGRPVGCSVALPSAGADSAYVSIDKRGLDPATPVDLLDAGVVDPDLVALLWLAIEHRQAIAFVGPERARPASLVEAHAPFIPFADRPVTVTKRTHSITLPHETHVALSTDALDRERAGSTPVDRTTELHPDVTVMTDLDDEPTYRHFADTLATGQGVLVSANADGFAGFAHRAVGKGVPLRALQSLDLVVTLRIVDGRGTVTAVEMPTDTHADGRTIVDGTTGELHAKTLDPDGGDAVYEPLFETMAARTDRTASELRAAHQRRVRYVQYLETADIGGSDALFSFLADLRTDEAATVERIHRVLSE
ncbi:type II/IV secretion system ATPase subunit [Halanaeroarchaeum sulfurireducens]|uniref:Type II secretion system protein n=1 Tax=Halanaeroarchaeum sulfurireducens TaxID=1604004 RepID=A0A0F7PCG1_9EURY|nr:type II/IV secretion system ATPase subunit [Halanaeroarchaeum sulfurireducens]AKH97053.1 type II secretion system protein [Halanaeroarchaeum sulfurireducens]